MTSLWKWSDSFFYLARQKVCIYKRHSEHSSAVCGRASNAIFNSDCSILPIQVFRSNHNHNNTDLKRKKFRFLLTPAEKKRSERKWRQWWIQLPSTFEPPSRLRDQPPKLSELTLLSRIKALWVTGLHLLTQMYIFVCVTCTPPSSQESPVPAKKC